MVNILLLFSLLLHGVSFFIIFLLYQKVQKASEGERNFEKRVQETEDLFSSYLLEIKDENKKFIETISKIDSQPNVYNEKVDKTVTYNQSSDLKHLQENYNLNPEKKSSFTPETVEVKDRVEKPSIQTQVMHLFENGYTIEEIAKKLNKGNTEIELIVKFNQKIHH